MAAEPKTRPTDADVDAFVEAVADPRRREDARTMKALLEDVSGERAVLWGASIVGFGSAEGPTGDWPRIAFSPRKAELVLYAAASQVRDRPELAERLGAPRLGSGCIYFKRLDKADPAALRELAELTLSKSPG